jgi:choline-sulfatase
MSSRRDFLKLLGGCALSFTLGSKASADPSPFAPPTSLPQDQPNVIFIVVDDLNDWIGCLGGHPNVRTPNLDRLAKRGVLFTNAYCAAPVCNPSRVSFLTGIRPSTSGVYGNLQPFRKALPNAVTLPQHFMANGYRVASAGKVFHRPEPDCWQETFPTFEHIEEPLPPNPPLNGIPGLGLFYDWGLLDVNEEEMGDAIIARWAVHELAKEHAKPFFLGVGITHPHLPQYVPPKYLDMYPPDQISLPAINLRDHKDLPKPAIRWARGSERVFDKIVQYHQYSHAVSAYLASITFVDAQIGLILDALDQSRYAHNTVIVVLGDNGYHLGEKLHWAKQTLWEESTHCPLIISAPGVAAAGWPCGRVVSFIDIYPTLIELCNLPAVGGLEGASLVPLLKNPLTPWNRPAIITYMPHNHCVRYKRWSYIRYRDGSEELYALWKDPLEWKNLAKERRYRRIKASLARFLPKVNAPMV